MIICAGWNSAGPTLQDVWAMSLTPGSESWMLLTPTGGPVPARWGHTAIVDGPRNRMVVFAGHDMGFDRNDTWALSLTVGSEGWTQLTPTGSPPSGRTNHAAVFDSTAAQRMVVFGGEQGMGGGNANNETWYAPLTGPFQWLQQSTTGPPTVRTQLTGVFDAPRGRMVVFGGMNSANYFNTAYALNTATLVWTQVGSNGAPSARAAHSAALDTSGNRMLIFGGMNSTTAFNDLYAFNLAGVGGGTWSSISPSGGPPPARREHTAIWDVTNARMIVYGGIGTTGNLGDVWEYK
jgi:hypothetical protein